MPTTKPTPRSKGLPQEIEPARGRVLRVYPDRGFGFIRCTEGVVDDVGQDFFFHSTGLVEGTLIEELLDGELVSFTPTYVPKGKRAEKIQREGA
jgi:cold shock CspA family protein